MARGKANSGKLKLDWKILAGCVLVLAVMAYILVQVIFFVSAHSSSKYENALDSYYLAIAKNDTNIIGNFITADFSDEIPQLKLQEGEYSIYSYQIETIQPAVSTNTNISSADIKMLFSISTMEGKEKVSYLAEAYFAGDKIQIIKKLHKGKSITKK